MVTGMLDRLLASKSRHSLWPSSRFLRALSFSLLRHSRHCRLSTTTGNAGSSYIGYECRSQDPTNYEKATDVTTAASFGKRVLSPSVTVLQQYGLNVPTVRACSMHAYSRPSLSSNFAGHIQYEVIISKGQNGIGSRRCRSHWQKAPHCLHCSLHTLSRRF